MECPKCHFSNAADTYYCGKCGTQLTSDSDEEKRQKRAESRDSHTETFQTPLKELTTGSTFAGRYQIIEELGHGGMGRVYKVFDTDIKEKIALKLLRPEIALDTESIERFSNELKLARKISHRNVCRMFDLGKAEGTTFITMEFVAGEDLKKLIRKTGQLGAGRAVSIAKQVCEGLAEAHHLGVIHRDLKPQNIMVDEDGNARIMDFGIARSLRGKGITGAGVMIGTPEYMSPEQVEGKEVDQRSDIYSLGIILYEMVTGHVPFEGDTPFTIGVKHKSERPRNPRELNTQLPEDLSRLILKCLEKDKGKRYQTAEELRAELEKVEQGLPTTERLAPKRKSITSKEITVTFSAKKLVIPTIAFLALIAAGIILWRVLPSKKPALSPSASGQPTIAVLYFENKSGDTKLDNWRDALAELLIADLSQSKYVRVISGDEMYTILKRLGLAEAQKYSSEDIEKIAVQTRATHVLRGNFIKAGESFIITASLQKPGTGQSSTPLRLEARGENDIIPKVDELTRQVKEGLNLTAAQIAGDIEKEAGKITTSSPEALKYYIEGRRHQLKMEYEQALANLEKAVEIDPEFAMAYRAMAAAYSNLGNRAEEVRKNYKKAYELRNRLSENERLLIESIWFSMESNRARAIEVLERLVKLYPGHALGTFWLAYEYRAVGNLDRAIEIQESLVQEQKTAINVFSLANLYVSKGLYQKAEDVCRSFLQDIEDNPGIRDMVSLSYLCRKQYDLALAEAEKSFLHKPSSKENIGNILLLKGDIAGAEKTYQQVLEKERVSGRNCLWRLALIRGKYREAVSQMQLNLDEARGGNKAATTFLAFLRLANTLDKAGRHEEALRAVGQAQKLKTEAASVLGPWTRQEAFFLMGRIQVKIQVGMNFFDEAKKNINELMTFAEKVPTRTQQQQNEYLLGLIELGKKNYHQAADFLARAAGRLYSEGGDDSDHGLYLDTLARAFYESGDMDKARQEYDKITLLTLGRLDHGDIYAKAYYMLGKIAQQQGDKARARENYRKFLDLWKDADPGLPEVADAKAHLDKLEK